MCEIDRDLVLRGAAYFATYAAERNPPQPDSFLAGLIEKALRQKLPGREEVSAPAPSKNGAPKARRVAGGIRGPAADAARATVATLFPLARNKEGLVRLLLAVRAEPDRVFSPVELAVIGGYPNPNKSGNLHAALDMMMKMGAAEKVSKGRYRLGPKGKANG